MKKYIPILLILCLGACSPKLVQVKELPKLEFERSEPYHIDLSNIPKPEPIKREYGKWSMEKKEGTTWGVEKVLTYVPPDELTGTEDAIILDVDEWKKVAMLVNLAVTYKQIIQQQEILINEKIRVDNGLKELIALERMKTNEIYSMWSYSENNYRMEVYERRNDQYIHKATEVLLMIGITALAF